MIILIWKSYVKTLISIGVLFYFYLNIWCDCSRRLHYQDIHQPTSNVIVVGHTVLLHNKSDTWEVWLTWKKLNAFITILIRSLTLPWHTWRRTKRVILVPLRERVLWHLFGKHWHKQKNIILVYSLKSESRVVSKVNRVYFRSWGLRKLI